MAVRFGVEVDGEFFTREQVKGMSIDECKMLMSQLEDMKDLEKVAMWKSDDDELGILESYVGELYTSIESLNKYKKD